jgi:branched-chain amino acid transport system ATP-binding protein
LLALQTVHSAYGNIRALRGISLTVERGEVVTLIGSNGAGKTTTLRACSGVIRPTSGRIFFDDQPIDTVRTAELVGRGLVHVPEDRALFGPLTIEENLRMGAWTRRDTPVGDSLSEVFDLFPVLAERRRQTAETLSGGQQQMLTIGRALMARPRLLMLDEPSTGLSPKLTWAVLEAIEVIRDRGVAVLLVEQNAAQALRMSDRAYVMESGSVVLSGAGRELAEDDRVRAAYLGL